MTRGRDRLGASPRVGCVQASCTCDHGSRRVRGPSSESHPRPNMRDRRPGCWRQAISSAADCQVQTQTGCPRGSARIVNDGASASLTRRRPRPAPRRCAGRRPPGRRGCRGASAGAVRRGHRSAGTTSWASGRRGRRSRGAPRPSRSRGPRPRTGPSALMSAVSRQSSRFWVLDGVAATPSSCGDRADPPGERDVALGDAAGVVAPQPHQDGRPRQRHVGVVVGLLGGRTDACDEVEARREAAGLVPRLEGAHDEHPVGEALVLDLGRW